MRVNLITKKSVLTRAAPERAFLVAAGTGSNGVSTEVSMEELAQLVRSDGAEVVGKLVQRSRMPSRSHYLGKGKLEELVALRETTPYDVVIFDDELTPAQQRNSEESLKIKVIDRAALILDIFARRAQTHEGKLQVELAQLQYLLPRLAGQWSHLERLGAGIGTRGPGESQLETDRRVVRHRIEKIKERLEQVRRQRTLYRAHRKRTGVPVVALVGYTNAGKSTLLNTLSQANVLVEDRLFSTLDPTTRRITLPDKTSALLTDTVGFIRKLPPMLVTAFRATLEELSDADLLLHIVDVSSRDAAGQCQTVEEILAELGLKDKPRITVLNKIDLLLPEGKTIDESAVMNYLPPRCVPTATEMVVISAEKGWGVDRLLELTGKILAQTRQQTTLNSTIK